MKKENRINMVTTNVRIRKLKERFQDPEVPVSDKMDILEFFKEFNEIFYGDIDIDSFFRQLEDISRRWDNE